METTEKKPKKSDLRKARKAAKKLAKIEKLKQIKRDYLQRELKYTEKNYKTLKKNFHDYMMKTQLPSLKQDMQTMWHRFELAFDRKNFVISLLLDDIDADLEQYEANLQGHTETIDKLFSFFLKRLDELKDWYKNEVNELIAITDNNEKELGEEGRSNEEALNVIRVAMCQAQEEYETSMKAEFFSKLEDLKVKCHDIREALQANLEAQMDRMWLQVKQTLVNYQETTAETRKQYNILKKRDDETSQLIQHQLEQTFKLIEKIRFLKDKLATKLQNQETELGNLQKERNFYNDAFEHFRQRLSDDQNLDERQLLVLTLVSDTTTKKLKQHYDDANRLLALATICRKYETQSEKVLPFPPSDFIEDERQIEFSDNFMTYMDMMEFGKEHYRQFMPLEGLIKRIQQAEFRGRQVIQYHMRLIDENTKLKKHLAKYMACMQAEQCDPCTGCGMVKK